MIKQEIRTSIKVLFVEKGYDATNIAAITGVDRSTVYNMINAGNWRDERTNNQFKLTEKELENIPAKPVERSMITVRKKAKELIKNGYTQKETSKLVGVSEKTMSQWCKLYRWKHKKYF